MNCFMTGKEAAVAMEICKAKFANTHYFEAKHNYRVRIVRHEASADTAKILKNRHVWQAREAARFADGSYIALPWANEDWFKASHDRQKHFAHVGTKSRINVAFTMSAEHGALDRQTSIKPGRYLERYFADELAYLPYVTVGKNVQGEPIKVSPLQYWADKYAELYGDNVELQFADTEEGFEEVYTSGPSSCMARCADDFETGGVHPVTIYAAGDLAVAYLTTTNADDDESPEEGRITARTLCWPAKKLYSRVYGDCYKLERELRKLGYTQNRDWSLDGARLKKEYLSRSDGQIIMPYIDAGCGFADHPTDKKFFIMSTSGRYRANNTNGTACVASNADCSHCGSDNDGDAMISTYNMGRLCDACADEYDVYVCAHSERTYAVDVDEEPFARFDGRRIHPRYRRYYNICAYDGHLHYTGDMIVLGDGRYVATRHQAMTAICHGNGRRYLITDMQRHDGQFYCKAAYDALIHTAPVVAA
jgi:hypothetical protein